MLKRQRKLNVFFASLGGVALLALSACGGGAEEVASNIQFPAWMANANNDIRTAYEFAVQRPDVLQFVPCYCGCGNVGHKHNEHCFVKQRFGEEMIEFDQHGFA